MTQKAKQCDECKEFIGDPYHPCAAGHAPRFYSHRKGNPHDQDWGYKRRCNSFDPLNEFKAKQ